MNDILDIKQHALPAADRAEVIARLRAREPQLRNLLATSLFLFGSAARDELTPTSDVDVFIDYDPEGPFSFVELIRLRELVGEIVGREVDLLTRDGLHPVLKSDIEQSSIRVF